ncbi:MAG: peptide chain release factor N(5)-glutamine methyltransferase [Chloroflexi bacterium]|nr:peptide chain release factor N(5)-glutamine methyltransferase [Chloroflexota bacterium]
MASLLESAERQIRASGADASRLTAIVLLERASGLGRERLIASPERELPPETVSAYESLVARRCCREPLAYIQGWREFFGRRFKVSPRTLIPRPESEGLVELVLAWSARRATEGRRMLDVGTGSGAIAVTLLAEIPGLNAVATDIDPETLLVARENARSHGVGPRVQLVACNIATALRSSFDLITANLPYIPTARIDTLEPEVRLYEPHRALDGGATGTTELVGLLRTLPEVLEPGGAAFLEIGEEQSLHLQACAQGTMPNSAASVHLDAAGLDRYLIVERPG